MIRSENSPQLKTILVTGSNGFLGAEVVHQLLAAGFSVRATGIETASLQTGVEYHQADILQPQQLSRLVEGISLVIHTAGLAHVFDAGMHFERQFHQINEIGTINMISAAQDQGVKHFILISTVSVYGSFTEGMYDEETPCNPVGPYALSKYNAEQRAQKIAQKVGMSLTILRLATLYGEGDPGNVGRLMHALDGGSFFRIGNGNNRKSLLYKGDAARACLVAASRPANAVSVYNVSAPPCAMRDIVDGLATALGKKPVPIRIPAPIALTFGKILSCLPEKRLSRLYSTIEKWLAEDVYDTSCIERDYGFYTQVDLIEGLKREVRWYRQKQGKNFR